jgi:hypothetical protein
MEAIKRLMILLLAKLHAPSEEIAMALGVDSSGVRKIISMRSVAKLPLPNPDSKRRE